MYDGEGVPEDDAEAARWFRLAADQGLAGAQYDNLGNMYADGRGVPEDDAEAARWFRLAADQGLAGAQLNLGVMYANGEGVLQDNVTAHMWFNIAGANGAEFGRDNREIHRKENDACRHFGGAETGAHLHGIKLHGLRMKGGVTRSNS